jgi:hypothetical protein
MVSLWFDKLTTGRDGFFNSNFKEHNIDARYWILDTRPPRRKAAGETSPRAGDSKTQDQMKSFQYHIIYFVRMTIAFSMNLLAMHLNGRRYSILVARDSILAYSVQRVAYS